MLHDDNEGEKKEETMNAALSRSTPKTMQIESRIREMIKEQRIQPAKAQIQEETLVKEIQTVEVAPVELAQAVKVEDAKPTQAIEIEVAERVQPVVIDTVEKKEEEVKEKDDLDKQLENLLKNQDASSEEGSSEGDYDEILKRLKSDSSSE